MGGPVVDRCGVGVGGGCGGVGAPMVWAGRVEKGGVPKGGDPNPGEVGVRRVRVRWVRASSGGSEGWEAQNFRAFFFLSRRKNSFFSSLSGGLPRGILVVFEAPGRSNVHVWRSLVGV